MHGAMYPRVQDIFHVILHAFRLNHFKSLLKAFLSNVVLWTADMMPFFYDKMILEVGLDYLL